MAPDDVVAIASLLRDPAVEVLAITVTGTGEAHCPGGLFLARSIVTMLLPEPIPVACGARSPLGEAEPFPAEWRAGVDAGNGLRLVAPTFAPDARSSEELLVELSASEAAAGRRLTILTIGTVTNLAGAVTLDPTLPDRVKVVSMLGAVDVPGNAIPADQPSAAPLAEWNAHADPTAVRIVLEAGFDLTIVPLDATNDVPLTRDMYARLEADHAAGPADLVFELWARNPFLTGGGLYQWDPLTAAVVRQPGLVTTREARLRVVEGAGIDGGQLIEDPAGAAVTMAISADRAAFEELLLGWLRIGGPRPQAFAPVGAITVSVGPDRCEVAFDPADLPAGVVQLDLTSTEDVASAILFGTAGVPWAELEAFARDPDTDAPPPVTEIAGAFLEAAGETTSWGVIEPGEIGVGCLFGDFESPEVVLRGPFQVGP
jgi:pyrimidine-specific ribonucleoside hydrolase